MLEIDFLPKLKELINTHGGKFNSLFNSTHCIYLSTLNGKSESITCIGNAKDFVQYARENFGIEDVGQEICAEFESGARITTSNMMRATGHSYVYLDFIDGAKVRTAQSPEYGNVIIEL